MHIIKSFMLNNCSHASGAN